MKGKIDKFAILNIAVPSGVYVPQTCVYKNSSCKTNCPLFEEPETIEILSDRHETTIKICQGRILRFTEFKDERGEDV